MFIQNQGAEETHALTNAPHSLPKYATKTTIYRAVIVYILPNVVATGTTKISDGARLFVFV